MGMNAILNKIMLIYKQHVVIFNNLFFIGIVQFFGLIAPLVTYPYLVDVLGMELYGIVITAQVLVSYTTLIIDYGSNSVCAKDVSIHRNDREKLSEIISSVLSTRFVLWIISFFIYALVVILIPTYREHLTLFLISYLLTMNELLFPQFFFQGLEKMKVVSQLNILIKLVFIILVFFFVKTQSDYLFVPFLYAIGYTIAGAVALYIIFKKYKIKFVIPSYKIQFSYFKECSPIFATDLVCTIKDKLNYMFVGSFVGMSNVVVYDLGLKLIGILSKPANIITTVLLPRFAQNRDITKLKKVLFLVFLMSVCIVLLMNLFLKPITELFLHQEIDLIPLRLFSIVTIFLCIGTVIANNFFIGFGYNKYMFYSILTTTAVYIIILIIIWFMGYIHYLYSYIFLTVVSYLVEFAYRLYVFRKFAKKDKHIVENI